MAGNVTIVDNDDPKAVLSVDDLIMKIGLLVVEIMQKERMLNSALKRAAELEKRLQETDDIMKEVEDLRKFKDRYDSLSKKYSEVVEEVFGVDKRKRIQEEKEEKETCR